MTIKKEITLGQLIGPIIVIIGMIGGLYAMGAKVDYIKEDIKEIRTDIRELRGSLTGHVQSDISLKSSADVLRTEIDKAGVASGGPNNNYANPENHPRTR
jgi:hypothetical protein